MVEIAAHARVPLVEISSVERLDTRASTLKPLAWTTTAAATATSRRLLPPASRRLSPPMSSDRLHRRLRSQTSTFCLWLNLSPLLLQPASPPLRPDLVSCSWSAWCHRGLRLEAVDV